MHQPDSSSPTEHHWFGRPIHLTEAPCIISLDCVGPNDEISLSAREVVGAAYYIIAKCELAKAGWMHLDGSPGWLVTVMGATKGNDIMNATMGETGNSSLLENDDEGYIGLTETS